MPSPTDRPVAATARGLVHELDPGRYRAVVRDGVPMIERDDTAGAVRAVMVPVSPELLDELSAEWSEPVRFRIADGEFVFKTEPSEWSIQQTCEHHWIDEPQIVCAHCGAFQ